MGADRQPPSPCASSALTSLESLSARSPSSWRSTQWVAQVLRLTEAYFKRIEAVEFAVKHDDGQAKNKLAEAEIILVGISQDEQDTSVTNGSKGWKVANVPLAGTRPLLSLRGPQVSIKPRLTIDVASLMRIRRSRPGPQHAGDD